MTTVLGVTGSPRRGAREPKTSARVEEYLMNKAYEAGFDAVKTLSA